MPLLYGSQNYEQKSNSPRSSHLGVFARGLLSLSPCFRLILLFFAFAVRETDPTFLRHVQLAAQPPVGAALEVAARVFGRQRRVCPLRARATRDAGTLPAFKAAKTITFVS